MSDLPFSGGGFGGGVHVNEPVEHPPADAFQLSVVAGSASGREDEGGTFFQEGGRMTCGWGLETAVGQNPQGVIICKCANFICFSSRVYACIATLNMK